MSLRSTVRAGGILLIAASLVGGCAYDSLQHEDRVSYNAGDAVRANLEIQTINPSKKSMNDTSGLGKNGEIEPVLQP